MEEDSKLIKEDKTYDQVINPPNWEGNDVICRRKLDEERGNPWICECMLCKRERGLKGD